MQAKRDEDGARETFNLLLLYYMQKWTGTDHSSDQNWTLGYSFGTEISGPRSKAFGTKRT